MKKKPVEHLFDQTLRDKLEDLQVNTGGAGKLWDDFDKKYPPALPTGNGSPVNKWLPLLSIALILTIAIIVFYNKSADTLNTEAINSQPLPVDSIIAHQNKNPAALVTSPFPTRENNIKYSKHDNISATQADRVFIKNAGNTNNTSQNKINTSKTNLKNDAENTKQKNIPGLPLKDPKSPAPLLLSKKFLPVRIQADTAKKVPENKPKNVNIIW